MGPAKLIAGGASQSGGKITGTVTSCAGTPAVSKWVGDLYVCYRRSICTANIIANYEGESLRLL
jgi:hypothetical protein